MAILFSISANMEFVVLMTSLSQVFPHIFKHYIYLKYCSKPLRLLFIF